MYQKRVDTGSITIFLSLMLILVSSLLFSLLEVSRYQALGMMGDLVSQSQVESLFAEYNIPAYEDYHLLMLDAGYGKGKLAISDLNAKMQKLGQENLNPVATGFGKYSNFLQMNDTDSSLVKYELATDHHAAVLLAQMAEVMKKEAVTDMLTGDADKLKETKDQIEQGGQADQYMDDALETIQTELDKKAQGEEDESEQIALSDRRKYDSSGLTSLSNWTSDRRQDNASGIIGILNRTLDRRQHNSSGIICLSNWKQEMGFQEKESSEEVVGEAGGELPEEDVREGVGEVAEVAKRVEEAAGEVTEEEAEAPVDIENPIEDMKAARSSPILVQILPEGSRISAKELKKSDLAINRNLNQGNYGDRHQTQLLDKLLIVQYLKKYTSNYCQELKLPHALQYEQEYLLFGKESDEKNLEKMAMRLVLLREGMNFAYLMTDAAKQGEAMAAALEISAAMGIPVAANAIQMGLLAAWAYAESILELRTLFAGGKVAVVKTAANWNTGFAEMTAVVLNRNRRAAEVSKGQAYEDFLQAFLYVASAQNLGMNFAALLEQNLRLYKNYEQTRIDCMMTAAEISCTYDADQVFLSLILLGGISRKGYGFQKEAKLEYVKSK